MTSWLRMQIESVIRQQRIGVQAAVLLGLVGCHYGTRTLVDGKIAPPSPVLPVLPMVSRGYVSIGAAMAMTKDGAVAAPLHWSSERPFEMSGRQVGVGAELRVANNGTQYWLEFADGQHAQGMDEWMLSAMAGHELRFNGWSLMPWVGLGMGIGDAEYSFRDEYWCQDFGCDRRERSDSEQRAEFLRIPLEHRNERVKSLLTSIGITAVLFREDPVSPFLAGRFLLGGSFGEDGDLVIANPVDLSRGYVDVGIRWKVGTDWCILSGVGANRYMDDLFRGSDLHAYLGVSTVLMKHSAE